MPRGPRGAFWLALGSRALWWVSASLLAVSGSLLVRAPRAHWDQALALALSGVALATIVLLVAAERRMRVLGLTIAAGHAALALLAWAATSG